MSHLTIETRSDEGVEHLVLIGEFDLASVPAFEDRIATAEAGSPAAIVVDLSGLEFMDSSGLHVVLNARALCERSGYGFQTVGGTPAVRRLFEVCGLASLIAPQRP